MLKNMIAAAALAGLVCSPGAAFSMPVDVSVGPAAQDAAPVESARLFCYNRFTGRFLHWGGCGFRRSFYRPRPRYRVYCYSRRTGRFLHWGHC